MIRVSQLTASVVAAAIAVLVPSAASAEIIDLRGNAYALDTVSYTKAGPGTTHTHLELRSVSDSSRIQVHYLTVDRSAAPMTMQVVSACDMVAGNETTSGMAVRSSNDDAVCFAGANGDFYEVRGTASNGTSIVGSPLSSSVVEGEIYSTALDGEYQFVTDADGGIRIGRMDYSAGTASAAGRMVPFVGVNVAAQPDGITLYTPRYYGTTNQGALAGKISGVIARIADGEKALAGTSYSLTVTSRPDASGDIAVPADGYVIMGSGAARKFVDRLRPGDIVEFNSVCTVDGQSVTPQAVVSGKPKIVGGGLTLDSEHEREGSSDRHPRTAIGYSLTGDSIIMMVAEGRSPISKGVRTSELGDLMRYAKAWEAINLDGGGSSTLYTSAHGVLNNCSDGRERAVGNAIFAVTGRYEQPLQAKPCLMRAGAVVCVDGGTDAVTTWTLTDVHNRVVATGSAPESSVSIPTAGLESGLYLITINTNGHNRSTRIIVL